MREPTTTATHTATISFDHVNKVYPPIKRGAKPVLAIQDISFTIAPRQFVSVVGPSGCGKSTLIKMLAGLLPITGGEISIDNAPVRGPHSDIGIVFQSPVLLKWRSVIDNVLLPADILRLNRNEVKANAEELLKMAGLWEFRNDYPTILSGGMQQRVSLCRALLHDPSILVMDEPFGALDALTREEMNLELLRIWSQRRKTVLFITHSIPEAVFLSDSVVVMTPRPSQIDSIFEIALPRPRTPDITYDPAFQEYVRQIRARIGPAGSVGYTG